MYPPKNSENRRFDITDALSNLHLGHRAHKVLEKDAIDSESNQIRALENKLELAQDGNLLFVCDDTGCSSYAETSRATNKRGGGQSQYYGKRSSAMVKVPKNVKKWAQYAFTLKKLGFEGATETGWKRAHQLASREYIPIEDLRYMRNWYARHIVTSYPGFKKWIDAGKPKDKSWHRNHAIQSWITWGANAGFKWVNSEAAIRMLNNYFGKNYKRIRVR